MHVLVFLLGVAIVSPVIAVCPYNVPACKCHDDVLIFIGLDVIPPLVSNNEDGAITSVIFQAGNINSIPDNSLPSNLATLQLISVPISYISPDAFTNSSTTLTYLKMENSMYNQVPEALLKVQRLTNLHIYDTTIPDYTISVLQHIGQSVQAVTLHNIGLTTWPTWLLYFTSLNSLDFSSNNVSTIPSDAFASAPKLKFVSLRGNQLSNGTNLVSALLPVVTTLSSLAISDNKFSSVPADLDQITGLTTLDIISNMITEFSADRIPQQLKSLNIGHNQINQLTDTSFPNPSSLVTLYINDNPLSNISDLAFLPLQHLKLLSLSSTNNMEIPLALTSLKNLEVLITGLTDTFHCPCPRDDKLVRWYNFLESISIFAKCHQNVYLALYFREDTYRTLCSGFAPLDFNVYFLVLIFLSVYIVQTIERKFA